MITVLHVLEAVTTGCARHVADLVANTRGVRHHLACPAERVGDHTDHAAAEAVRAAGGEVHWIEMRRSTRSWQNVRALTQVRSLVGHLRPDVVHSHSSIGGAVARVATLGMPPKRVHTPNGIATGRFAVLVERALARHTDVLVAVSATEAADAVRLGLRPRELVTIPNGIAVALPPARSLRALTGVGADVALVGFAGRLVPQKAPEVFVAAATLVAGRHPDVAFVLVGDGDLADAVAAAVAASPADIRWLRFVPELAAHLGDLDVLAMPSRFEGGPYVPLEAMRAGVAVVASDVTGNRDTIEHDRTGLLVPVDDPEALADAVVALLEDPARRAELGTAAARAVVADFDVARMGGHYGKLYARLAAGGVPRSNS